MHKFTWTPEQENVFNTVLIDKAPFVKITAVAGASKTTTLVELAARNIQANPDSTFRYLIFGNANATEARSKFGTTAICSTLHALAYDAIYRSGSYKLSKSIQPFLTWKHIPKSIRIPFGETSTVIDLVDEYNNSAYTDFRTFELLCTSDKPHLLPYAKQILAGMFDGSIKPTHSFYLKLYHLGIMSGTIVPAEVDILAIDECGDLTQITIDIFDKYPAKQKIMVGDDGQAIFHFMGCINGFDYFHDRGLTLELNQSFRVATPLAKQIQSFCNSTFAPDMIFKGMDYPPNPVLKSHAYITRTNSALVAKMVELNKSSTPYRLVSKSKINQLFKYPNFLMYMKAGTKQYDSDLKALQHEVDYYEQTPSARKKYKTKFAYIKAMNKDNPGIVSAINLLMQYSYEDVQAAYAGADDHKHANCDLVLCTGHTSKGKF